MHKFITRTIAVGAVASVGVALLGNPSSANPAAPTPASGCANGVCMQVLGEGLYVSAVRGYMHAIYGSTTYGHFQYVNGSWSQNSPNEAYSGDTFPTEVDYGPWVTVDREFPNDSELCAIFWVKTGTNSYRKVSGYCATIHD